MTNLRMVTCKVDREISGTVLGYELPPWQAILVHKVLPSIGGLCIYLVLMCFDVAMVFEHYKNGDKTLASFLIVMMIMPSVISLIFTLASPPPGLQTEDTAFAIQIQKSDLLWIFWQILNCVLFPVAAIGRYCHQIFWWIEAVCTAYTEEEDRLKEALRRAHEPSPLELYLFLQAFVHAAPNAVVNILDLMMRSSTSTSYNRVSIQAVSIIASTLRMASTAAVYRRFEREKLCGKQYPWKTQEQINEQNTTNEQTEQLEEHIYEPLRFNSTNADKVRDNSNLIQFSPTLQEDKGFFEEDYESDTDFLEPISARRKNSEDEYVRPISIIDRVAPRRRDTQYTIENVRLTPPPEIPAPRPMSLAAWAEKVVENAEAIPSWLSAPHRSKYHDDLITEEPDIPRYSPRPYLRGLEPQDATAALVHFLGWYMFFVSRLLSIAAFINFYPVLAITTLFTHYQVMLLLLIVPKASTVRRAFYIFLAFIYLFCLMEFKIRFRHVRVWHVFWLVVCTVETIIFTALWANVNNTLNWWWKEYVIVVIFGSLLLSYMCLLVYFVLLKPRETIVYIENKESK